jgi:hypothetical protein
MTKKTTAGEMEELHQAVDGCLLAILNVIIEDLNEIKSYVNRLRSKRS